MQTHPGELKKLFGSGEAVFTSLPHLLPSCTALPAHSRSNSSAIGGRSAGTAMGICLDCAFLSCPLNSSTC